MKRVESFVWGTEQCGGLKVESLAWVRFGFTGPGCKSVRLASPAVCNLWFPAVADRFRVDLKSLGSPQDGNRKTLSTIAGGPTRAAVTVCASSPAKSKRPRKSKSSDPDPRLRELVKASSKVTLFPRQYIQYIPGLLTMSTAAPFVCKCQRNE